MAVFRVERNTGYTVMSNHHLRNKELSLKAKGLLSQMLSLPEDWDYSHKSEIVHTEIMLPPHAPPEYADRNTLWNAAEAIEKQWNSQLARRFVLAIPRELPPEQYADLIRDYCREFFVSKGMIADFAIHDKGDGNTNEKHPKQIYSCKTYNAYGKQHCSQHRVEYDTLYRLVLNKIRECARAALMDGEAVAGKLSDTCEAEQKGQREALERSLAKDEER
uniref:MobA/MobL family protein n=1 Tax=Gemmiger formicilis TaxID=745368 RepID=UPI003FED84A7